MLQELKAIRAEGERQRKAKRRGRALAVGGTVLGVGGAIAGRKQLAKAIRSAIGDEVSRASKVVDDLVTHHADHAAKTVETRVPDMVENTIKETIDRFRPRPIQAASRRWRKFTQFTPIED